MSAPIDSALTGECEVIRQVARFTALESRTPMGKTVWLEDGRLQKRVIKTPGEFIHHPVEVESIEDLADAFRQATERVIFISGVCDMRRGQTLRRLKEGLPFAAGPGVMFLDNDVRDGGDQFFELYAAACRAMASASYVYSIRQTSVPSNIALRLQRCPWAVINLTSCSSCRSSGSEPSPTSWHRPP